jgi:hypothetical protein
MSAHGRRLCTFAVAVAATASCVPGADAQVGRAADASELKLAGPAAKSLRAQGVRVGPIAPADGGRERVTLPVTEGTLSPLKLDHEGGISLRANGRTARLTALRLAFGKRDAGSFKLGRKRVALFAIEGRPAVDSAARTIALRGGALVLTRKGARALRRALDLERLPAGRLARLSSRAELPAPPPSTEPPFQVGDLGPPPPVMERPAGAEEVSAVSISLHPRDSWLRYVAAAGPAPQGTTTEGGASVGPVANASPCPDRPVGPTPLVYSFSFAAAAGSWFDADSGTAALYGSGALRFRRDAYGIDISMANPEVEFAGSDSRVIFTFTGAGETAIPTQRAVLVDLVTAGAPTSTGPAPGGGTIRSFDLVRGDLTEAGSAAFGAYPPGDDWGCISASFTTGAP